MNRISETVVGVLGQRFYYGWWIVAVAGLGIFASGPGQSHTFSVFIAEISRDLEVSSTMIASAYGLATLVAALLLPFMGCLFDRHGGRLMLGLVTFFLGLACLFFGAAANFLWLTIGFAFLRYFGQGSLMLGGANLMAHWFNRKRGFAVSLMSLGFGVSMAVHPPLSAYLIDTVGWRIAWYCLGLSTWLVMLPAVIFLVVNRPEDIGVTPDRESTEDVPKGKSFAATEVSGLTRAEALRTAAFYILAAGCFAIAMLVTTLHFYQVTILTSHGIESAVAARIFIVSAIAMVALMPVVGALFDRFPTRFIFAAGLLVTAGCLTGITFVDDGPSAIFYAVLFGLNNAFGTTTIGYVWPRYFGRLQIGAIQGTGQLIGVVGASLGPLPVGLAFDAIGNPDSTLRLLALLPLSCALLALFLRTPKGVFAETHLD